jgi:hypothetical protein
MKSALTMVNVRVVSVPMEIHVRQAHCLEPTRAITVSAPGIFLRDNFGAIRNVKHRRLHTASAYCSSCTLHPHTAASLCAFLVVQIGVASVAVVVHVLETDSKETTRTRAVSAPPIGASLHAGCIHHGATRRADASGLDGGAAAFGVHATPLHRAHLVVDVAVDFIAVQVDILETKGGHVRWACAVCTPSISTHDAVAITNNDWCTRRFLTAFREHPAAVPMHTVAPRNRPRVRIAATVALMPDNLAPSGTPDLPARLEA